MARRKGFLSRIAETLANALSPARREKAADKRARDFGRTGRGSAKDAERWAQQRRDAETSRKAHAKRPDVKRERERRKLERDPYQKAWKDARQANRGRRPRGSYQRHRNFFLSIPGLEYESDEDIEELWESYIEHMVYGARGTRLNKLDNPFWNEIGIAPEDFDWRGWREQMGYNKRRK